ncbi:SDR family NAD(P)-dependent oxidoreductase [Streptomyces sp. NPDC002172]
MTHDLITSSFNAVSTAAEVVDGNDLHGKRLIVTGGSSGIGIETARALAGAGAGADVLIAVRNPQAGHSVAEDINTGLNSPRVTVAQLDLADLSSVRRFAAEWDTRPLHALIHNAGIMATPLTRTVSGWELQFATNHLGHFRTRQRPPRRPGGRERCPDRLGRFPRPSALARRVRRHQLPRARLRSVAGLRTVQNRQCALRR